MPDSTDTHKENRREGKSLAQGHAVANISGLEVHDCDTLNNDAQAFFDILGAHTSETCSPGSGARDVMSLSAVDSRCLALPLKLP